MNTTTMLPVISPGQWLVIGFNPLHADLDAIYVDCRATIQQCVTLFRAQYGYDPLRCYLCEGTIRQSFPLDSSAFFY